MEPVGAPEAAAAEGLLVCARALELSFRRWLVRRLPVAAGAAWSKQASTEANRSRRVRGEMSNGVAMSVVVGSRG